MARPVMYDMIRLLDNKKYLDKEGLSFFISEIRKAIGDADLSDDEALERVIVFSIQEGFSSGFDTGVRECVELCQLSGIK